MGYAAIGAQVAGTVLQAGANKASANAAQEQRRFEIESHVNDATARAQTYDYQAAVAENNALIAQWQEQDARTRGQITDSRIGLNVRQMVGKQKASFAARGIDATEGSALRILDDTAYMGAVDIQTANHNTEVEAYSYKVAAQNAAGDAAMLKYGSSNARNEALRWAGAPASGASPNASMLSTLLTGAGSVANTWYTLNSKGAFSGGGGGGFSVPSTGYATP